MSDVFTNSLAENIFKQRYSMDGQETWEDTCHRVVESVCGQYMNNEDKNDLLQIMIDRKFIPAGRYLYSAGRPYHMICNCFAFKAEDTREGWGDLLNKTAVTSMSGGGIGVVYSAIREKNAILRRTGGISSGPLPLMHAVNESNRYIRQGGHRRGAIWAGLAWWHNDIYDFMDAKNYSVEDKQKKLDNIDHPLPLDGTNISVIYDTEFFVAIKDRKHPKHKIAKAVWEKNCLQAFSTAEPGFAFNWLNDNEDGRNACQPEFATVMTKEGIKTFKDIDVGSEIWDGSNWVKVVKKWKSGYKPVYRYDTTTGTFIGTDNHRVVQNSEKIEVKDAESIDVCIGPKMISSNIDTQDVMDGLVIGDGGYHKASNNLIGLYIGENDSDYFGDSVNDLILKERFGISKGFHTVKTTITVEELPKTPYRFVPDRFYYGDRDKQCGFLRGLFSANGSINGNRVCLKQTSFALIKQVQMMLSNLGIHSYITVNKSKENQFNNGMYVMKQSYDINITNGRSIFKDCIGFIQKYKQVKITDGSDLVYKTSNIKDVEYLGDYDVYEITVNSHKHVYWSGACLVSNCTEFITEDDSDRCNLGTVWINRISDREEFSKVLDLATKFLICGGEYSDMPTEKSEKVGKENNKIGVGLGGIHEWMVERGDGYNVTPELHKWLRLYQEETDGSAYVFAKDIGVNIPKKKRAIAPNGTIGILAESTTGIEPILASAYKRRYMKDNEWKYEYVVDGAVKRLTEKGISLDKIQDAYDIPFEQRVKVQADIQQYVDMAISSTCNLPKWGSENNNEETLKKYSKVLLKYAKRLRGFTCYPDGCRGGQPLTKVDLKIAMNQEGFVFDEKEDRCIGGVCGV